ncbi:uncharacterized protein LOC127807349 isoform X2 [Diospyros lotus]|uniref:uncharacterized protein LOC127807349 isoform X2 n=1 Tax=Diospyros lotus TaxID=55363 RepID=UPI00225C3571|nr:uncharacterized protein LOC127807349 isoform X2 [Diospyros lotus]
MAAIGWYGPLIDLSKAFSHIGDYVQLLVFVHRSTPVQYKLSKGGEIIRTDIQVGDDTRPFFSVSVWQKQIGSVAFAGDIVLLQNVSITKFQDVVEAKTVHCSSLQCLVPHESLVSKGVEDIIGACQVGARTKEKLRKVIEWVKQAGYTFHNRQRQKLINWKLHEERDSLDCFSLLEVSRLTDSVNATFYASIGEIFLLLKWKNLHESNGERMFISRRLSIMGDKDLAEDFICTGCQLCGSPLTSESGSNSNKNAVPLYCQKSSNHLHMINLIYRPFMLYVWDDSKYIPLLVTNKAAELLFGNIKAEKVQSCYRAQKHDPVPKTSDNVVKTHCSDARSPDPNPADKSRAPPGTDKSSGQKEKQKTKTPDYYTIWITLLKILMQREKNGPLKFKVTVNVDRDLESGRFEMVSVTMPCF